LDAVRRDEHHLGHSVSVYHRGGADAGIAERNAGPSLCAIATGASRISNTGGYP
jgi:hypothetical protein